MRVIGTAGHVDHGKSALVAALTGIHPDRLKEEQVREMTIDLGFAWMTLPDGEEVGIVDVPGHRDFIENMLAGVGGIDAVLFVVAVDEGIMPQTREHLAIIDLLKIPAGVIVITKIDLVEDPDWISLVEEDIRQVTRSTVLENAPIVGVSAKTRAGLPELKTVLMEILASNPARPDTGRPRLPVDRVFTIQGFGTVVTGTLLDGMLRVGEEVEILPEGLKGRIRGLQSHQHKVQQVKGGSRTAVNLAGVEVQQIQRGSVVAKLGQYQPTTRLDVQFFLLPDASHPLRHNETMKLFLGAAEVIARVRLLETDQLQPGSEGWLQLETSSPVVAVRGDRYILRRPSPGETIGGGMVVDPHARRRYKRFAQEEIQRLYALFQGTPTELLQSLIFQKGFLTVNEAVVLSHLPAEMALEAIQELHTAGLVVMIDQNPEKVQPDQLIGTAARVNAEKERITAELMTYHQKYPLRGGMQKEELRTRFQLPPRVFQYVYAALLGDDQIQEINGTVSIAGFQPEFNKQQQQRVAALLASFERQPYAPPSVKECQSSVGEEIYSALLEMKTIIQVSPDVVFRREEYQQLLTSVRNHFSVEPTLTVAQLRDQFNTSRRYVLAFLEHLDAIGVTVRDGDIRKII